MSASDYDLQLQQRIDAASLRLAYSPDPKDRMRAMDELRVLKRLQRGERIEGLERERGLR